MFVPHGKHTYSPPWTVAVMALLFYMWIVFVSHRKHTYEPQRTVNRESFAFLYADDVRTSQEPHPLASSAYYGDTFTLFLLRLLPHNLQSVVLN
jgi:hypothetical protein